MKRNFNKNDQNSDKNSLRTMKLGQNYNTNEMKRLLLHTKSISSTCHDAICIIFDFSDAITYITSNKIYNKQISRCNNQDIISKYESIGIEYFGVLAASLIYYISTESSAYVNECYRFFVDIISPWGSLLFNDLISLAKSFEFAYIIIMASFGYNNTIDIPMIDSTSTSSGSSPEYVNHNECNSYYIINDVKRVKVNDIKRVENENTPNITDSDMNSNNSNDESISNVSNCKAENDFKIQSRIKASNTLDTLLNSVNNKASDKINEIESDNKTVTSNSNSMKKTLRRERKFPKGIQRAGINYRVQIIKSSCGRRWSKNVNTFTEALWLYELAVMLFDCFEDDNPLELLLKEGNYYDLVYNSQHMIVKDQKDYLNSLYYHMTMFIDSNKFTNEEISLLKQTYKRISAAAM